MITLFKDGDIVKDQIGSISNGTRCNLSRLVDGREELFSVDTNIHDDEDYNFEDVFMRAVNNIFDTSSIVKPHNTLLCICFQTCPQSDEQK